jgi:hypothetical protein
MSTASAELPVSIRLKKSIRDGAPWFRRLYSGVRRAAALVRDRRRRAIVGALPDDSLAMSRDAGFLIVPPGTFSTVEQVVHQARDVLATYDASSPPAGKSKKRFLVNVLEPESLTLRSAIVQFALRDDVLAMVSRYLGLAPLMTSIAVFHSDTVDGVPTSSQLYHCDADDVTQVKAFVYCSDVDTSSGPLTILDARTTGHVQRRTGYRYGARLTDDQVRTAYENPTERAILGAAGTVAFVDTSRCLHFGSRVAAGAPARLVVMIQYQTPYSFMLPSRFREAVPFRRLLDPSLGPLQRLALGE